MQLDLASWSGATEQCECVQPGAHVSAAAGTLQEPILTLTNEYHSPRPKPHKPVHELIT